MGNILRKLFNKQIKDEIFFYDPDPPYKNIYPIADLVFGTKEWEEAMKLLAQTAGLLVEEIIKSNKTMSKIQKIFNDFI